MQPDDAIEDSGNQDRAVTIIIPVTHPIQRSEVEHLFLRGDQNYGATASRPPRGLDDNVVDYRDRVAQSSAIRIFSTGDSPQETVAGIMQRSDMEASDELTRVAECAAFWKSVGADTLIYACSLGATVVANGLVIRFTTVNPLYSTLVGGGIGAVAYNNAQVLFTSLLKPPRDDIPEENRTAYGHVNKYALLPFSFIIKAGVTGSILSALGDTNFGTQQAISAATSPVIGPVMTAMRMGIRKCYQGSYVLAPETPDVREGFQRAYSSASNPVDADRPYRYGIVRDMFAKLFGVTASTLMLSYSGGFRIESYCYPLGNQTLGMGNMTGSRNSTAFPEDCFGGNLTFMFRELGISFGYAVGFLIVEPILATVTNKIYDYFYPAAEEDDDVSLEEL